MRAFVIWFVVIAAVYAAILYAQANCPCTENGPLVLIGLLAALAAVTFVLLCGELGRVIGLYFGSRR